MGSGTDTTHPTAGELADYFAGRLAQSRESELDRHFGECDDCAAQARRMRLLSFIADRWTAREHGRQARAARLARALERAREAPGCESWQVRISRWLDRWAGKAEGAAQVVLEKAGDAWRAQVRGMEELARPGALWPQFAPEPALAVRGEAGGSALVVTPAGPAPRAKVEVSAAAGLVEVSVDEPFQALTPPLVLLVPDGPAGRLQLGELRRPEGGGRFTVVFRGVEAGRYVVAIEPSERAEPPPGG
jgi:hypothetical protein